MTTPTDAPVKVHRVANDVDEIYEMLKGITKVQQEHGQQLTEIDGSLTEIITTQAQQYDRLDTFAKVQQHHGDRLSHLDRTVTNIAATQVTFANRLDEFDRQLAGMGSSLAKVAHTQGEHSRELAQLASRQTAMERRVGARLDKVDGRLATVDGKLNAVLDLLRAGRPAGGE